MLAYRLGLAFHVTSYGMYGFAILSSADARQALNIALESTPPVLLVKAATTA